MHNNLGVFVLLLFIRMKCFEIVSYFNFDCNFFVCMNFNRAVFYFLLQSLTFLENVYISIADDRLMVVYVVKDGALQYLSRSKLASNKLLLYRYIDSLFFTFSQYGNNTSRHLQMYRLTERRMQNSKYLND